MARTVLSTLLVCYIMNAQADLLASREPALGLALMDGYGAVAACDPGSANCPQAELSLLQNHALGIAGKSGATAGAAAAPAAAAAKTSSKGSDDRGAYISITLRSQDYNSVVGSSLNGTDTSSSDAKLTVLAASIWVFVVLSLLLLATLLSMNRSTSEEPGLPKYVAEFVGTFMLVFSVGCNVLVGDATWGVVSIACTLMVAIYALGSVSGGNFNPAVSVALGLSGKLPAREVLIYSCTQLAAGLTAGLAYAWMLGTSFNLAPSAGFSWWQAGLAELLYTFMLCFTVLNTAASQKHSGDQFFGLAIGFSVVAGGYGAGSISGGCFNPAVALGIDAASTGLGFGECFVYFIFEILGACLAALFFRFCRPDEFDKSLEGQDYRLGVTLLSEFLGTYMLVLTVGLNVLAGSKAAVFSIAASLMCMIFSLGSVSGAHFNPAVTTAILCSCRGLISVSKAVAYIAAQLCGGILAAFTYSLMQHGRTVALQPSSSSIATEALIGEFAFTFLLSFVVLSVATVKAPLSQYFGLAIGSCVMAGGLAIGSLSGGSLNPAVSAGLAISDATNGGPLSHLPSYVVAELLAGVTAASIFRVTHVAEYVGRDEKN